jgi:hypothetical protein
MYTIERIKSCRADENHEIKEAQSLNFQNCIVIPEGYTSSIPKALKFMIMYRIVVIDTFLGVGLQKVYCQFRYLLSSFFLLDRFIPNFGNLLNLISYATTGYFRWYLLKFFLCIFSVIPMCIFSSISATACLVCIYL